MKILLVNKYFYHKGGSETYFFGLRESLIEKGHEIIDFSMKDDLNFYSNYQEYFIDNIDYEDKGLKKKIKNSTKLLFSYEAYKNLCKLIEKTKPDVAHINLIYHQISPSIFHALKKYKIPIVFTSHDYKIICPNYKMLDNNGDICDKCISGRFINCAINKCQKDSFLFSGLLSLEAYIHKFLGSYQLSDKIICPSEFMYNALNKSGIPSDKLVKLLNFTTLNNQESINSTNREDVVVYFGRLSHEKGIDRLIDAFNYLSEEITLNIIGTGSEEEKLKNYVKKNNLKNVNFLGYKKGNDLEEEIRKAKVSVIPSVWNEVFGLTIIESYKQATPVIGSNLGAIPEIVKNGKSGFTYQYDDSKELASKIEQIVNMPIEHYEEMQRNCISDLEKYSLDNYTSEIEKIYSSLVKN